MLGLSLKLKFGLLLGGFALAISTIVLINFRTSTQVGAQLQAIDDRAFPRLSEANYLSDRFVEITRLFEDAVILGEAVLIERSREERNLFVEHLENLLAITPETEKEELHRIRELFDQYYPETRALTEFWLQSEIEDEELFGSENVDEVAARAQSVALLRGELENALQSVVQRRREGLTDFLRTTKEGVRTLSLRTLAIGLGAFFVILFSLVYLTRRIVVPIRALSSLTRQVASGDFTEQYEVPLASRDEVGDLVASFQNMTQSLRETTVSKDYVDNIVRSMGDSLIVADSDGTISMVNRATRSLLGYEESALLGKPIEMVFAETSSSGGSRLEAVMQRGLFSNVEEVYLAKHGGRIPVSFTATPMHADGAIAGVICVARDITEHKQAEQDLKAAVEAAEAANEAKSAFLANMSHELRTPLNAVIGYSEMLREDAVDEGLEGFVPDLEKINGAGKHLLSLINDVLDLSKIEAGKMELFAEEFEVADLVEEVVSTVQPLFQKNENSLSTEIAPDAGLMHTDQTKVRQTLMNLLSNAAKFTEHGQIKLQVERERADETDWLKFQVEDTGIGMNEGQAAQVFDPFVQADSSTTREYGGTGLGLAITQRFCRMMGGDITLASEPGVGTTFTVRLPSNIGTTSPTVTEEVVSAEASEPAPVGAGEVVLVIDDDASVRDLMQRYLQREGFSVVTASSGPQGLQLAKEVQPLAITLDVFMPGMDGWSVLEELKADEQLAEIPVILVTMVDDRSKGYALGAVDYLTKPVDRGRLAGVLAKLQSDPGPGPVLLVEDDGGTRELLRRELEREGLEVVEAENGRVGLERVAEIAPRLILLDLIMPEMDGFEFVEKLRQNPAWMSIPVVVVTGKNLLAEDRERLGGHVGLVLQKDADDPSDVLSRIVDLVHASRQ